MVLAAPDRLHRRKGTTGPSSRSDPTKAPTWGRHTPTAGPRCQGSARRAGGRVGGLLAVLWVGALIICGEHLSKAHGAPHARTHAHTHAHGHVLDSCERDTPASQHTHLLTHSRHSVGRRTQQQQQQHPPMGCAGRQVHREKRKWRHPRPRARRSARTR